MSSNRLSEIDITRGSVMVLMALDHTRDFFGNHSIDALDVAHSSVALFFARWLTHLCAPTFVFLAGISVALARSKQPGFRLSQLALRGLWLVVLEQTFLRCFGRYFNFDYRFMNAGILWGTGWAMVLLAGILALRLPSKLIGILGLALMAGHSFLAVAVDSTWWGTLILRSGELLPAPGWHFYVSYPVLPWFGVMAFGYGAGSFIQKAGFNPPMPPSSPLERNWYDSAICPAQDPKPFRSRPLGLTSSHRFHAAVLYQYREISAFVPVPINDLRTDGLLHGAGVLSAERDSAGANRVGASTAVLLPGSHCPDSPLSVASRVPPVRTCRVAVSRTRDFLVGDLAWPSAGVRFRARLGRSNLVAGDSTPMAGLPVVRPV
jgi:Heparan-alpha-glucosaminide N-acetyltransferase, catalytic